MVALLSTAGTAFASYRYDAWGNPTAMTTQAAGSITAALAASIASRQVLRYAGYVWDAESKTYYCSARQYDPATMQFLSKDPAKADGEESAYQYCAGDPVGKVDPSGLNSAVIALGGTGLAIPGIGWVGAALIVGAIGLYAVAVHGIPWIKKKYSGWYWSRWHGAGAGDSVRVDNRGTPDEHAHWKGRSGSGSRWKNPKNRPNKDKGNSNPPPRVKKWLKKKGWNL